MNCKQTSSLSGRKERKQGMRCHSGGVRVKRPMLSVG